MADQTCDGDEARIDGLPIPVVALFSDHGTHRIEAVSSGFAKLFSTTSERILASYADDPLSAVVEPERESALSVLEYALMYPDSICVGTFHLMEPFCWPDGDRLVRCSIQAARLAEGRWRSYVTFSPVPIGQSASDDERPRDLTERMLEEQILARLSTLGYEIVGMISVQTGGVRYFRMKKMHLGLEFEDVEEYRESIEGDIDRVIAEEDREDVRRALTLDHVIAELGRSELYSYPFSMTTRDGRHLRKLLQFTYMDDSRSTIFICRTDISSQYQEEIAQMARLKEAKAAADAANEAKSVFLSSMSHDLRTPLNGIIGFTDLAIRTPDLNRKQEYLTKVKSSSALLLDLVNDTLDLSRIESGKLALEPSAVSLRESIQTVITSLGPSAEIKHISLITDLWTGPDRAVWMDQLKFQKILLNLLSNAIKYTPSGGTVHVRVELADAAGTAAATDAAGAAGAADAAGTAAAAGTADAAGAATSADTAAQRFRCRLEVADNGIGIAEDFIPHVFDAFAQEHRPGTAGVMGTGLGLAIVKRLVNLMGGTIGLTSTLGEGSTFSVSLPLELAQASVASAADSPACSPALDGTRILVCEDNYLNMEIIRAMLDEEGVQTTCAGDGAEGVRCFLASQPGDFSAILMDVRMPVMDGLEATRHIRASKRSDARKVPIIALTGDVLDEDVKNCEQAGMSAVVGKPIDRVQLISVLSALVSDGDKAS